MSTVTPKPSDDSNSIAVSQKETLVNQGDPTLCFTATGRPMQVNKPSGLANMPGGIGFTPEAPQFLPVKFNDDDIIPVPVLVANSEPKVEERKGFMGKMKGLVSGKDKEGKLRVVYMPRREYLKYFAKDDDNNYVGTEPQKSWTDEELDKMFAKYVPPPLPKSNEPMLDKMLSGLGAVG
jgi:hypothetical protein